MVYKNKVTFLYLILLQVPMKPLPKEFFAQDTLVVAKELLGKVISYNGFIGRIVETEAYIEGDPAAHCCKRTERSTIMFDTHGYVYVYLIYGMYYCLNFTTDSEKAGAVLIRAVEPLQGIEGMKKMRNTEKLSNLCNGPGKLCQAFGIDKELNGVPLGDNLVVFDEGCVVSVGVSSRVGITKAVDKQWRFFVKGNEFVSKVKKN